MKVTTRPAAVAAFEIEGAGVLRRGEKLSAGNGTGFDAYARPLHSHHGATDGRRQPTTAPTKPSGNTSSVAPWMSSVGSGVSLPPVRKASLLEWSVDSQSETSSVGAAPSVTSQRSQGSVSDCSEDLDEPADGGIDENSALETAPLIERWVPEVTPAQRMLAGLAQPSRLLGRTFLTLPRWDRDCVHGVPALRAPDRAKLFAEHVDLHDLANHLSMSNV